MEILVILAMAAFSFWFLGSKKKKNGTKTPRRVDPPPVIDMPPESATVARQWVRTSVKTVDERTTWKSFRSVKITLDSGHEVEGLLPRDLASVVTPGYQLEVLLEYDDVSRLKVPGRSVGPKEVIEHVVQTLSVTTDVRESKAVDGLYEAAFEIDAHEVEVSAVPEGHLSVSVMIDTGLPIDVSFSVDTDEPYIEQPSMLGDRLWMEPDEREESAQLIDSLSGPTLERLEEHLFSSVGIMCGDNEALDFDWFLPFLDGELAAALVSEALEIARTIEREAANEVLDEGW